MTDTLRDEVRRHYARAALAVLEPGGCCSPGAAASPGDPVFGPGLYDPGQLDPLPADAVAASLGCGNPTAMAELRPGEIVLDLGSGGGIDVLLSAQRVGPSGIAYGLDMTDEMLELARRNAGAAGASNATFLKGEIEAIPLPDASVDVVISNCVINLSTDKPRVFAEIARVLRPGGRVSVSDVVADDAHLPGGPGRPRRLRRLRRGGAVLLGVRGRPRGGRAGRDRAAADPRGRPRDVQRDRPGRAPDGGTGRGHAGRGVAGGGRGAGRGAGPPDRRDDRAGRRVLRDGRRSGLPLMRGTVPPMPPLVAATVADLADIETLVAAPGCRSTASRPACPAGRPSSAASTTAASLAWPRPSATATSPCCARSPCTRRFAGTAWGGRSSERALADARAAGAREAWLLTETADPFFAGLGWSRADRADAPAAVAASVEFASACPTTAIAMRRPL